MPGTLTECVLLWCNGELVWAWSWIASFCKSVAF